MGGAKKISGTTVGAVVMAVLLGIYIVAVLYRAVLLFKNGGVLGGVMALALLVLSLIAFWALYREVRFGFEATKLSKQLEAEGGVLELEITADAAGRPNKAQAQQVLGELEEIVAVGAVGEHDWRAWQRLGIVRRAAGDYAGSRKAVNTAIKLAKFSRNS